VIRRGAAHRGGPRRAAAHVQLLLWLSLVPAAGAEGSALPPESAAPADSAAVPSSGTAPPAASERRAPAYQPGPDRERLELGVGLVRGYFDAVGSLAYRRYVRERRGWAQFAMGELSGTKKGYLSEGVASAYYLFRHRRTWKPDGRLRPLLEAGPGAHLAVQSAHIVGFNERPFHAKVFLKVHAYAGLEALLSSRVGLLIRGRLSVPEHRPLDYAQAAIFRR